nr:hypothetical protein [Mycobacterium marinum]
MEQKNWAIVRTVVGHHRYDTPAELVLHNKIWVLQSKLANYFCPQQKLVSKVRAGAKVSKKYDTVIGTAGVETGILGIRYLARSSSDVAPWLPRTHDRTSKTGSSPRSPNATGFVRAPPSVTSMPTSSLTTTPTSSATTS